MARTKISEFSATAADNTDIDNIDIAEGCAPSGINNAIRELMSQLKDMQTGASGDTFTLTTVNSTTVDTTNLEVTNLKAKDGTAAGSIADSTGLVTLTNLTGTTADYTNLEVTNLKAKDGTASASIADSTGVFTHSTNTVFPAGAVATPSITTAGDTNTGMYFPAADTIGFAAGGVQSFSVGTTASAVNYLEARGAATAAAPRIVSLGSDTNVPMTLSTKGTGEIRFSTNSLERMRVDGSGYVGIGTDTPGAALHVAGVMPSGLTGSGVFAGVDSGVYGAIQLSGSTGSYIDFSTSGVDYKGRVLYDNASNAMSFFTDAAERARITSAGKFYVGATTAFYTTKVAVNWDSSAEQGITLKSTSTTFNGSPILFINNADGVSGAVTQSQTAVLYATTSDYRLKENVLPMTGALAKVAALKPCTYTWKVNGSAGQGFIAHELQEIVPDCVMGDKDGVDKNGNIIPQAIDTSFLVATLTAAIQEQQSIISAMETRLAALEAQ